MKKTTPRDIFLNVPNLIGYVRIILAIISFHYMGTDHIKAASCYLLNVFLDEFDGIAARLLNQSTKFGAVLDMLTDRVANACLMVTLAALYPAYAFCFQISLGIDIVSHWMHMHSLVIKGADSHKSMDFTSNPILRIYYTSSPCLSIMCIGNEVFFIMLYLLNFTEGPPVAGIGLVHIIFYLSAPIMTLKTLISIIQLVEASIRIASIDADERDKEN